MKISVRESGGYAGIENEYSLDTTGLKDAERERLTGLVTESGFFDIPDTGSAEAIGADMVRYEITITDNGRESRVVFNDDGSARIASLKSLVETVKEIAR